MSIEQSDGRALDATDGDFGGLLGGPCDGYSDVFSLEVRDESVSVGCTMDSQCLRHDSQRKSIHLRILDSCVDMGSLFQILL